MLGTSDLCREVDSLCLDSEQLTCSINKSGLCPLKKNFTVTVEGNIGCGKSTFLEHFLGSKNVEIYSEPVEMWKNLKGVNVLDLMYKDAKRWSLAFQSYVQLTMLQIHAKRQSKPIKLMERSIFSARYCFVENLFNCGSMPSVDHSVLEEWYQWLLANENVNVDLVVYLRASPEICYERLKKRNREEESTVPLSYLTTLHDLHEDWLVKQTSGRVPAPVLVLDANKDISLLRKDFEMKRRHILCGYD